MRLEQFANACVLHCTEQYANTHLTLYMRIRLVFYIEIVIGYCVLADLICNKNEHLVLKFTSIAATIVFCNFSKRGYLKFIHKSALNPPISRLTQRC